MSLNWDPVLRRYTASDDLPMTTFGPLKDYYAEPMVDAARLTAVGRRIADVQSANDNRPGEFMQTFTGRKFWPLDPKPDEIHIEDIAHALANQCRYGGHCERFYSVAEHSVLMARTFARRDVALWALLHDAAEAYVADVPRPLKKHLAGYKDAEAKVMAAVCEKFGLAPEMPLEVKAADEDILGDEICQNMRPMDWHADYTNPLGVTLQFWEPERAEDEFLLAYWDLADRRV